MLQIAKFVSKCHICNDARIFEDVLPTEDIITCCKCGITVHRQCYGAKHDLGPEWTCVGCEHGLKPSKFSCLACPNWKDHAVFPTTDGRWIHISCATWLSGCRITENQVNAELVEKRCFTLVCEFCRKKGACVQCSFGQCLFACHVTCGLRNGVAFSMVDTRREPRRHFCSRHTAKQTRPLLAPPTSNQSVFVSECSHVGNKQQADRLNHKGSSDQPGLSADQNFYDGAANFNQCNDSFNTHLFKFFEDVGATPLLGMYPTIQGQELSLYQLYKEVSTFGGLSDVPPEEWTDIYKRCFPSNGIDVTKGSNYLLAAYKLFLKAFDHYLRGFSLEECKKLQEQTI